ncbi:MAG: SAM-dependent methyltransferase [Eubacteriaceae bacterium]|nr:SAM-dependent methyltransferase [Eubacteriaceae bacterium]
MNNSLSMRLKKTAQCAYGLENIADIGSDHSYLAKYLLDNNMISYALCVEAVLGPYNKSVVNLKDYISKGKADVILSNGIDDVCPENIDGIVIAGMGGNLILEILSKHKQKITKFKRLILQPQNAQADVRKFLHNCGFEITDESVVYEKNKFYEIICAEPTDKISVREEIYYEIPLLCVLNKSEEICDFIRFKQQKLNKIITSCQDKNTKLSQKRIDDAVAKIKDLEVVLKCLQN